MTALKALLTGILCLVLLALLAGLVCVLALFFDLELRTLALVAGIAAAICVLFFAGRRVWLFCAGRRLRKQLLARGPAAVESPASPLPHAEDMEALCRAGLAVRCERSLQHTPLLLFLGSGKSNARALAQAIAPGEGPTAGPGALSWQYCESLTAMVPDPSLLALTDSTTRAGFAASLAQLCAHNPAEPVTAMVAVITAGELAACARHSGAGGMESALAARDLAATAHVLRARMEDVLRCHKAHMPLHLLITGIEDLAGMRDLLRSLSPLSRQALPGLTFAQGPDLSLENAARSALAACADQLDALILQEACLGTAPTGSALDAPAALSALEEGLTLFLRALLLPHVEGRTPFLRSIRLASLTVSQPCASPTDTATAQGTAPAAALRADSDTDSPAADLQSVAGPAGIPVPDQTAPAQRVARAVPLTARTPAGPVPSLTITGNLPPASPLSTAPSSAGSRPALPAFTEGLAAALARDRALYASLEEGSARDKPRAIIYGTACLVLLGLCALISSAALHASRNLNEAARLWEQAEKAGPAGSFARLTGEAAAIHVLQAADAASFVTLPGFGRLGREVARTGRIFQEQFQHLQDRVLAECADLAARDGAANYTAMQRLLWLSNAVSRRLDGQEPTQAFPMEAEGSTPTAWTPDFGTLFVTHLSLASQPELANLQQRLASLSATLAGRDAQAIFTRLCEQQAAAAPRGEFPMSRYWPNAPRGSAGFFSVPAIYTPEGFAFLADNLTGLGSAGAYDFRSQPFWKQYLQRYADVWARFAARTDNAWLVTDSLESLQRMSELGQGMQDPYLRLLRDMAQQLEPLLAEKAAPAWVEDVRLAAALLLVCDAKGSTNARSLASVLLDAVHLTREDAQTLLQEVRERKGTGFLVQAVTALEAYLACIEELRTTLTDPEGSLSLAAIDFGGKEYGDPDKTALARARAALKDLATALTGTRPGRKGPASPAMHLLGGPLRFLEQAVTYSAAVTLQERWESEVLPQAALLPPEEALEGLFGEKGLVTQFLTQHTAPFLTRSVGAYRARTRGSVTFPFADAFLNAMQEGSSAQANPVRESYQAALHTAAAALNPDAAERLEYYELSLACRKGPQKVRNANYPNDAVFAYEPSACTQARLSFSFPSLKLAYDYPDFRAFLEDFSFGERVFTPHDFPGLEGRMERLRISSIRVRILADDAPLILSAFSGEIQLPQRIVSIW